MSFVVIFEGCDKTGKTTTAKRLGEMLEWPVLKFGQPGPEGAFAEYARALVTHDGPFIADRFYMGESVYGPIYRGTEPMRADHVEEVEEILFARGALLVLMEDYPFKVAERFREHNEDFAKDGDILKIMNKYEELFRACRLPKIRATLNEQLPVVIANLAVQLSWRERAETVAR